MAKIEKLTKIVMNELEKMVKNGGEGSGDFDHAGRPGEVGGSEPAGTGRKGKYDNVKKETSKDKWKEKKVDRPFKSKDGNEIKDAEYKGCDVSIRPDGKYSDIRIYAPEGKTFPNGDTFYTTQALTEKAEEHAKLIIDGTTKRNEWIDKKPSEKKDEKHEEKKYTIPQDYKNSVKDYTKEKHEQAVDFYGEKMATFQKKSVAHPDNKEYREKVDEYEALTHYHEKLAKEKEDKQEAKEEIEKALKIKSKKEILPSHAKLRVMPKEELIRTFLIDDGSIDKEDDMKFYKQFHQTELIDKIYKKYQKTNNSLYTHEFIEY